MQIKRITNKKINLYIYHKLYSRTKIQIFINSRPLGVEDFDFSPTI